MPSMIAVLAVGAAANCWVAAADKYKLPPYLLYAIASQESSYNPNAISYDKNGTHSVGLMQINSSWFPTLEQSGITEADLYKPCVNVQVGAWILSQEVARYGYSWVAIGSYNAGPYYGRLESRKLETYRSYSNQVLARWRAALDGRLPPPGSRGAKPPKRRPAAPRYAGNLASRCTTPQGTAQSVAAAASAGASAASQSTALPSEQNLANIEE